MRQSGFTLMELMLVVALIGLIAALVGPDLFRDFDKAREEVALTQCKQYYDAVWKWRIYHKTRRVPETLEEIEDDTLRIQDDPWGSPFRLVKEDERRYRVWSNGADGVEGTDDDICYIPRRN
jgi:general secretion pathway protein G